MPTYIHTFEHTHTHTQVVHSYRPYTQCTYTIYAYIYSYIRKYIHYVHTYIHTYTHTYIHTHTRINKQALKMHTQNTVNVYCHTSYYAYMCTEFGQALRVWRQHNDKRLATTIPRIRVANIQRLNTPKKLIVFKLIWWWWWWWLRFMIMMLHNDDNNNDDGSDNDESTLWRNKTKSFKCLLYL